jgi:hypothetical protein
MALGTIILPRPLPEPVIDGSDVMGGVLVAGPFFLTDLARFDKLITLYIKAKLFKIAEDMFDKQISIADTINFYRLKNIRNKCAHEDYIPTINELEMFHFALQRLLQEIGFIDNKFHLKEPTNCPLCKEPVKQTFTFCPFCEYPLKRVCPSCNEEVDEDFKTCPACRTPLKKLEEKKTDFLMHILAAIAIALNKRENCPICGAVATINSSFFIKR